MGIVFIAGSWVLPLKMGPVVFVWLHLYARVKGSAAVGSGVLFMFCGILRKKTYNIYNFENKCT